MDYLSVWEGLKAVKRGFIQRRRFIWGMFVLSCVALISVKKARFLLKEAVKREILHDALLSMLKQVKEEIAKEENKSE